MNVARWLQIAIKVSHSSAIRRIACFTFLLNIGQTLSNQVSAQENNSHVTQEAAVSLPLTMQSAAAGDVLHLVVGRSMLVTSSGPLRRVYVGNPTVLQTYTSGSSEIVMTAKMAGQSSMVLWDEAGGRRLYTVFADVDPTALRSSLEAAYPDSPICVDAGEGKIFLTGSVATEVISEGAVKMALQYAKEVVNSLQVIPAHGKQVQLKLRIVEVDRTRLEQMGINIFAGGRTSVATSTGQFGSVATGAESSFTVSNPLNIFLFNEKLQAGITIQDLEQKQVLQVLAEPTLTTLSGLPARFLSGGEFPFPVVQGGTGNASAVTIQFRPYGVRVDFTPTVNPDSSIHLKLSPEVSTLDYSNAVTISGFTIPALSTRRSDTEVEIKDGESFIVSGLLDHRTTQIMSRIPGIASVPILGQLFRSRNFNHSVVELVIIVTASIVDPLGATPIAASTLPHQVVPDLDIDSFDASMKPREPPPTLPAVPVMSDHK